jgi:PST family polysaccharide transporter
MLPALSRVQNDKEQMRNMLLKFQKMVGIILLPLGVGIFIFSDLLVEIMLGNQWMEASGFVGLWGLMSAITIIFARFCSYIYPAMGKPRLSVLSQFLHLIVLVPAVSISVKYSFEALYITRSLIRFEGIAVNLIFAYFLIHITFRQYLRNIFPELIASTAMGITAYLLLMLSDNIITSIAWIPVCMIVYYLTLRMFPGELEILMGLKNRVLKRK